MPTPDRERDRRFAQLLHHRHGELAAGDSVTLPLVSSSVFHLPGDTAAPHTYGRPDTPVWQAVEAQLGVLEDAGVVLFPSGMAAIASVFYSELQAGSRVLVPADGYYMTRKLLAGFLDQFDVDIVQCPTTELAAVALDGIDVVFIESPSNPGLDVLDIEMIAQRAHDAGALLVVDNTTCTAALQQPLALGADIVVCSDTKTSGGHSDLLMGHVACRDDIRLARIRAWRTSAGAIPGPYEAWLLHRGLETLDVRLQRMCANAQALAEALQTQGRVQGLRYPGLIGDPAHTLASRQMAAPGQLLGFELEDAAAAERFIGGCPLLVASTSFGGVHSSAERRARWGDTVADGFIRLSAGCEPTDTLCETVTDTLATL